MTPAEVASVARRFGIDADATTARELEGGYSNETWYAQSERGAVVVRRYGRLYVTPRAIAFEHAILTHAGTATPFVRAPYRASGGETYLLDAGAYLACFPFVLGTTGERTTGASRDAALMLAAYHRSVRDVHMLTGMRAARSVGILAWLRERFLRFAADVTLARALDWDVLIAACSGATSRIAPVAPQLPRVVVHGDPIPENVVRLDEAPAGLIDFDFAHETERIYDVAAAADEYGRADPDAPLDAAAAAALVEGYDAQMPLSQPERDVLPDLMIRRNATMVWYILTRHGQRDPGEIGAAPRYAARVREIARRRAELATLHRRSA